MNQDILEQQETRKAGNATSVVGLDACKIGWVAVTLIDGCVDSVAVIETLEDFLANVDPSTVGIDIPIGLPDAGPRAADLEARIYLGNRRSSVFLTPPRAALQCDDHATASALCRELTGSGISRQSFGLKKKIFEVDQVCQKYSNLYEVHPEVSFKAMACRDLEFGKKTWNGLMERLALLAATGIDLPFLTRLNGSAAPDDVVDAAAAAWSAHRISLGLASSLPAKPNVLYGDRPIAIWY